LGKKKAGGIFKNYRGRKYGFFGAPRLAPLLKNTFPQGKWEKKLIEKKKKSEENLFLPPEILNFEKRKSFLKNH